MPPEHAHTAAPESFTFALADFGDAEGVHDVIVRAAAGGAEGHFVLNDLETIQRQMRSGFTITARSGDELAGVLHVYFPAEVDNWAAKVGDPYPADQVALMDIAAALPEFRGHGLMRRMLAQAEELLLELEPARLAWYGTVHPDNVASRRSFETSGYEVAARVKAYGGLPRLVMRKLVA